ncbi:MAG: hypothetical protein KIT84_19725 [Labilithrix sp.]|nr:hypothetical protein [Labilithrix sp.]MCW5813267.1 hypothetical protein [Labilithrix sp.]
MKLVSSLTVVGVLVAALVACSSDDDDKPAGDAAGSCTDLCTKSGFASGRANVYPHEINCFCEGGGGAGGDAGTGTVAAADCSGMCTALGKAKGAVFGSGAGQTANACQCD